MTLCMMLLCENGKNCVVASDGQSVLYELNYNDTKKIHRCFDGSIIIASGTNAWIECIVKGYNDMGFFYPSEKETFLHQKTLEWFSLNPDIRLWFEYVRLLEFVKYKNGIMQIKEGENDLILGICFLNVKDQKIHLVCLDQLCASMDDTEHGYLAVGKWETVNYYFKKEPWDISLSKEEAIRKATEVLDFGKKNCSGVGGDFQVEVFAPHPLIDRYSEIRKKLDPMYNHEAGGEIFNFIERNIKKYEKAGEETEEEEKSLF